MTNHLTNSASNAHRPVTSVLVAASMVVGISGACLIPFNPALAAMPDSMPLALAAGVTSGPVIDGAILRNSTSLLFASTLTTTSVQAQQSSTPTDTIQSFFTYIFRFFIPGNPV